MLLRLVVEWPNERTIDLGIHLGVGTLIVKRREHLSNAASAERVLLLGQRKV
jgi:hypothetical protein